MRKKLIILILILSYVATFQINLSRNTLVANQTKFRDFQYNSWKEINLNSNIFDGVRERDFLIGHQVNDAYEYNVATFYKLTGIRLAYIYNTSIIYPNLSECMATIKCVLQNPKSIAILRLSNLNRVKNPTVEDIEKDWVVDNLLSGKVQSSQVWATDLVLMTDGVVFAYNARFSDKSEFAEVDTMTFKSVLITKKAVEFTPKFAGICLHKKSDFESLNKENYLMSEWVIPEDYLIDRIGFNRYVPYADITLGSC